MSEGCRDYLLDSKTQVNLTYLICASDPCRAKFSFAGDRVPRQHFLVRYSTEPTLRW